VLAGDRVKDGKDAYWQVDTTVKTDNPGYISVNIKASYYVQKDVTVECKEGEDPGLDGTCKEKKWVEQDDVPRFNPKTVLKDAFPTELWQPGPGRPQPNPNIGNDVPRILCAEGGEAKIKMHWQVRYQTQTLSQFWSGDCPGRQTQLCDIHENFNGLLVGRERDYCPLPLVDELYREFPYPPIAVKANPEVGLVGVPTWFWAEGYVGGEMVNWACLDRAPLCVAVLLAPDQREPPYVWTVGAPGAPPLRTIELGEAYPAESPVKHVYEYDSAREPDRAFPVSLAITWEAGWHLATRRSDQLEGIGHATGLDPQTRQYPGGPGPGGSWDSSPQPYQVIQIRTVRLD
jgi:hypothetical protein